MIKRKIPCDKTQKRLRLNAITFRPIAILYVAAMFYSIKGSSDIEHGAAVVVDFCDSIWPGLL